MCQHVHRRANGTDAQTGELVDAIQPCSIDNHGVHATTQQWILHNSELGSNLMKIESYAYRGKCVAVDYEQDDNLSEVREACQNGILA